MCLQQYRMKRTKDFQCSLVLCVEKLRLLQNIWGVGAGHKMDDNAQVKNLIGVEGGKQQWMANTVTNHENHCDMAVLGTVNTQ